VDLTNGFMCWQTESGLHIISYPMGEVIYFVSKSADASSWPAFVQ